MVSSLAIVSASKAFGEREKKKKKCKASRSKPVHLDKGDPSWAIFFAACKSKHRDQSQPAAATTTTTFTALRLQTSLRFTRCKLTLGERKSYIIHVIVIIDWKKKKKRSASAYVVQFSAGASASFRRSKKIRKRENQQIVKLWARRNKTKTPRARLASKLSQNWLIKRRRRQTWKLLNPNYAKTVRFHHARCENDYSPCN